MAINISLPHIFPGNGRARSNGQPPSINVQPGSKRNVARHLARMHRLQMVMLGQGISPATFDELKAELQLHYHAVAMHGVIVDPTQTQSVLKACLEWGVPAEALHT